MAKTVIFDLGCVLINWDPVNLYRKLFSDKAEMDYFLTEVCNQAWNLKQDAGRTLKEATAERIALFPRHKAMIEAFYDRWEEMLDGAIEETVTILRELKAKGDPVYALTNWSGETFPVALERFDFLRWFDGIVVSGDEKLAKPDPEIFHRLLDRYNLRPQDCFFIDDSEANIAAAHKIGFDTHHFTRSSLLREHLVEDNLLQSYV